MHDIMQSLATISVLLILVLYAMSIGDYYTVPDDVTSEDGDEEKMYDLFKIAEWRYKISASSPAELPKPVLSPVTVLTTSLAPVLVQNLEMINHGDENKSPLRQSITLATSIKAITVDLPVILEPPSRILSRGKLVRHVPGGFYPPSTASMPVSVLKPQIEIEPKPSNAPPPAPISHAMVRPLRKRPNPEPSECQVRHPPKRVRRGESTSLPTTIVNSSRNMDELRRSAIGQSTDERLPSRPPGMLSKDTGPNVTVRHGPLPPRSSLGPGPTQPMVLRDSALWKRRRLPNSEEQPRVKRPKLNVFKDVQPPPPVMIKVKPLRSALRPLKRVRFDFNHITPVVKVKALRHPVLEVEAWAGGPAAAGLLVSDLEKRFDQGKKARSRIISVPSTKVADELEMRKRSWAEDLYDSYKLLRGVSGAFALSEDTAFVDHQVTTPSGRPPVASSTSGEVVPTDATAIDHTEVDGQATMDDSKNSPTGDPLNRSDDDNPASTKGLPYTGGITLLGSSDGFEAGGKEMDSELGDEDIWTGCDDSYDYTALMDALADNSISPETAAKFIKGYGLVIPADLEDTLSTNLHVVST